MTAETRIHPETGEILRRDVRPIEFSFKGEKFTVNMPDRYPDDNDNGIFTYEDLQVSEWALEQLQARRKINSAETDFGLDNVALA